MGDIVPRRERELSTATLAGTMEPRSRATRPVEVTPLVYVAAPVGRMEDRTRLVKFEAAYNRYGWETVHLAWLRQDGRPDAPEPGRPTHYILTGGGHESWRAWLRYPLWAAKLLLHALRDPSRVYHALGLESALPICVAYKVRNGRRAGGRVIFDDADRMSLVVPLPARLGQLLAMVERWVQRRSDVHIIPGKSRYSDGNHCALTVVAENTPSASAVAAARDQVVRRPDAALVLYVNGWLTETRGSDLVMALAEHIDRHLDGQVAILFAGRAEPPVRKGLSRYRCTTDLGTLSPEQALAWYRCTDAVVTLYDPRIRINRYAEPNKWGDAHATGTPVLLNREIHGARYLIDLGVAIAIDYGAASLQAAVGELLHDCERLPAVRAAARRWAETFVDFDEVLDAQFRPALDLARGPS